MERNTNGKKKKKVILTLCKVFPVTHSQAGKPTGFEEQLKSGKKKHTVRGGNTRLWEQRVKDIMCDKKYLSVREWTGRPYNSEQRELASFENVGLQHIKIVRARRSAEPRCFVDGFEVPIRKIASNDGMKSDDFIEWILADKNIFDGVIIHFTDFRY